MRLIICEDTGEIAKAAMAELFESSKANLAKGYRCCVALSGGSTPKYLFDALVAECLANKEALILLQNIDWFFSDERFVPHDDPQSNYRLAVDHLFSQIDIDAQSIYPIPTQHILHEHAAQVYEDTIRRIVPAGADGLPTFDLVFLGMGDDGHTASLFPKTELVERNVSEQNMGTLVESSWVEKVHSQRITFMPKLINQAARVVILAAGEKKTKTLERVLKGPHTPKELPVQLIQPIDGELIWIVDKKAAATLTLN